MNVGSQAPPLASTWACVSCPCHWISERRMLPGLLSRMPRGPDRKPLTVSTTEPTAAAPDCVRDQSHKPTAPASPTSKMTVERDTSLQPSEGHKIPGRGAAGKVGVGGVRCVLRPIHRETESAGAYQGSGD